MHDTLKNLTYGPVPSRRLGRSLGINNIPPKSCSYSCIYCQVGRTAETEMKPRSFYSPEDIQQSVSARVSALRQAGESIDYLTFVPDGEPTLDVQLGDTIDLLRSLGIPIAVISNGSLLWRKEVRENLGKADWVSLKVDSVQETLWRTINRPPKSMGLPWVLDGMRRFAEHYDGKLTTETMLISGINDHPESVAAVADFLARLNPDCAYLSVPTRPPAEAYVRAPREESLLQAWSQFRHRLSARHRQVQVESLTYSEGDGFAHTEDPEADLLAITAVHPVRQDAVRAFLARVGLDLGFAERLVFMGRLKKIEYDGHCFYARSYPGLSVRSPIMIQTTPVDKHPAD